MMTVLVEDQIAVTVAAEEIAWGSSAQLMKTVEVMVQMLYVALSIVDVQLQKIASVLMKITALIQIS